MGAVSSSVSTKMPDRLATAQQLDTCWRYNWAAARHVPYARSSAGDSSQIPHCVVGSTDGTQRANDPMGSKYAGAGRTPTEISHQTTGASCGLMCVFIGFLLPRSTLVMEQETHSAPQIHKPSDSCADGSTPSHGTARPVKGPSPRIRQISRRGSRCVELQRPAPPRRRPPPGQPNASAAAAVRARPGCGRRTAARPRRAERPRRVRQPAR
jgi:hypothetical protein